MPSVGPLRRLRQRQLALVALLQVHQSLLRRVRPVFQPNDKAVPAPELDVLAIKEPPGLLDCFGIARARQPHEPHEMSVAADEIDPILGHP
jgi:hypothetical protein